MGSRFEQRSDMINIFEKVAMPGVLRINCGKAKKKSRRPWEIIIVNTDKLQAPLTPSETVIYRSSWQNPMGHFLF